MRPFIGFLTFLLMLTACAAPAQPTTLPTETTTSESHTVTLDGTLQTSLLAVVSKSSPRDSLLFPLDPASGMALPGYAPISLGQTYFHAFSPDRHTLAVVSFPSDINYNGSLLLIDLPAWKTRRFKLDLAGWVSAMAFSPDGKRLAIAHGDFKHKLIMVNTENGTLMAQGQVETFVTRLKFTRSGEALMLYGPSTAGGLTPDPPQVTLLDVTDLSPRWSAELEEVHDGMFPKNETITQVQLYQPGNSFSFSPGLDFAPDQDTLYIVHADSEKLTTVNFGTRKIETVDIQPKLSWSERLLSLTAGVAHAKGGDATNKQVLLSPDGQFLYVIGVKDAAIQDQQGNFQIEQTPLGLEILQTSDGSRVAHVETDTTELCLSPDGHFLYLKNWEDIAPWSEVFDTTSRKIVARKEAFYATPALLMNGQFLVASTYVYYEDKYRTKEKYHMSVLQPSDLRVVADWTGSEFVYWLPVQ